MPRKKSSGRLNPLKPVCVAGLILSLFLSWALVFFALIWGTGSEKGRETAFAGELEAYDSFDAPKRALEGENPEQVERRLSRLQKQVTSVEEQLSVLKRRRALALNDRRYIPAYEKAAREAAEAFAFSAPVAAVAADALVLSGGPPSEESLALLAAYAARVSQARFGALELSARILAGELRDPAYAASVPGLENLLSIDPSPYPEHIRRTLLVDEFLLRAAKGDAAGASMKLNALLSAPEAGTALGGAAESGTAGIMRMGAEFFYDHQNPLKSAELFSRLAGAETPGHASAPAPSSVFAARTIDAGEKDMARAADALVLAGEISGARNIWLALSADPAVPGAAPPPSVPAEGASSSETRYRSLYNLAASSADPKEEMDWLEKLFSRKPLESQRARGQEMDSLGVYSIIRYTRFLDAGRGIAVLEEDFMRQNPLLDLELLRRRLDTWPPTRAAAEVWLLIGRNSGEESLYEWAAWYFDHQKLYDETGRLLSGAAREGMTGAWLSLHRALALIREGNTAEGENILKEAGNRGADWRIPANLGRVEESRRAVSAALEYYEAAATLVREKRSAALIQMRISRCLEALDRTRESRRAMEYALELDPDNLDMRRELRRLR